MVVEGEVVGNTGTQFVHGGKDVSVEVLVLKDRPEALVAGVVVTAARRAHRAGDVELRAQRLGLVVAELTAAVGVKDRAADVRKARRDGLTQRVEHEFGAHVIAQMPTEDATRPFVTHGTQVDVARADLQVGQVARPEFVQPLGGEVAVHEVRGVEGEGIGHGRDLEGPWTDARHPQRSHARGDRVVARVLAILNQVLGDARLGLLTFPLSR